MNASILNWVAALVSLLLVCGCAGQRKKSYVLLPDNGPSREAVARARKCVAELYPPRYRATQRGILTLGRRQFVCDGVLTVSPEQGDHLAVVNTLGLVTEVRVATNGVTEVLKVTPLFREAWSRNYVARDLRQIFLPASDLGTEGRLPDGRLALETSPATNAIVTRYVFSRSGDRLEELELSQQGRRLYQVFFRHYRTFEGYPTAVPCEFEVAARRYRMDLRTLQLTTAADTSSSRGAGGRP